MYFIYVFYLKSPPPHFPPTMYLFQPGLTHVVHGKLPGFAPTPPVYKKNQKPFTVHSSTCPSKYPSPHQRKTKIKNSLQHYGS